ncbi:MAG TPA: hypothetical protein VF331_05045 [Polyangiales bacterium]|jgi:hypothetical protein
MPGCCLVALLMFFGPRVVLACAWLFTSWYAAFDSQLVAVLGFLFLPWTSLAWMYTFFHNHGQLTGGYVVLIVLAALGDLGAYGGGHRMQRSRSAG